MKSKKNFKEGKYVVDVDDYDKVKDKIGDDDVVKIIDEVFDGNEVVEYVGEIGGEEPFRYGEYIYKYVWGKYPDGKVDVAVYVKEHDMTYTVEWFRENVINPIIKKQNTHSKTDVVEMVKSKKASEFIKESINPELIKRYDAGEYSLKNNPSLPSTPNYVSDILKDGFDTAAKKLKARHGLDKLDYPKLVSEIDSCVTEIKKSEQKNGELLLDIAKNCIMKEFGMDGSELDLVMELCEEVDESNDPNDAKPSDFKYETYEQIDELDTEVHKRRMINALNQGGAKSLMSLVTKCYDEIMDIDPKLCKLYSDVMAMADYQYYKSDNMEEGTKGGSLSIDISESKPKIIAKGTILPFLMNEAVKGILEVLTHGSIPMDEAIREYVISRGDYGLAEADDIRIGESLYNNLTGLISDDDQKYKHLVLKKLSMLPVNEFHDMMRNILTKTSKADDFVEGCVTEIKTLIGEFEEGIGKQKDLYCDEDELDNLEF